MATGATVGRGYRGGSYRRRPAGSRLVLYGLIAAVAVWLIGPFVWLFITSISYQRNLMARPLSFIPPEVTLDNYKMIFGLIRFHAEGQAAKILPSMLNSLVVASLVTVLNLVIGTTAGYAYARYRFPLKMISLFTLLFTRMLPTVVLIPAFFLMLRALGLQNTLTGLVVAYCSSRRYRPSSTRAPSSTAAIAFRLTCAWCCPCQARVWSREAPSRSCCAGTSSSSPRC